MKTNVTKKSVRQNHYSGKTGQIITALMHTEKHLDNCKANQGVAIIAEECVIRRELCPHILGPWTVVI